MAEVTPPKIAYSVAEACTVSSLGRSTIYSLIAAGHLKARRVGGRRIVMADSLHALLAADEGRS